MVTVTATATGLPGVTATFQATVLAPPSLDIVSGNNQSGSPGTQLPQPLTVVLRDANGLPLADRTITWQVTSGTGTVSPASSTTNIAGQTQTTLTLGATAGVVTVTATVAGLPGAVARFQATVVLMPMPSLDIVSGDNQSGSPGTQLPQPLTVVLRGIPDLGGRTITWQVTSGTGTVSPASSTTNTAGQTQTTLTLGATAGVVTVTADPRRWPARRGGEVPSDGGTDADAEP